MFLNYVNKVVLFVLNFVYIDISSTYRALCKNSTDSGTYYLPLSPLHPSFTITTTDTHFFGHVHDMDIDNNT